MDKRSGVASMSSDKSGPSGGELVKESADLAESGVRGSTDGSNEQHREMKDSECISFYLGIYLYCL